MSSSSGGGGAGGGQQPAPPRPFHIAIPSFTDAAAQQFPRGLSPQALQARATAAAAGAPRPLQQPSAAAGPLPPHAFAPYRPQRGGASPRPMMMPPPPPRPVAAARPVVAGGGVSVDGWIWRGKEGHHATACILNLTLVHSCERAGGSVIGVRGNERRTPPATSIAAQPQRRCVFG